MRVQRQENPKCFFLDSFHCMPLIFASSLSASIFALQSNQPSRPLGARTESSTLQTDAGVGDTSLWHAAIAMPSSTSPIALIRAKAVRLTFIRRKEWGEMRPMPQRSVNIMDPQQN